MGNSAVLQVVVMRSGSLLGTEVLVPGDYRIGRSDECDLHFDEPTLSRVHARLVFNGQRVGIQDLSSDNGILINGEKVKAREVKSLDDVLLGKISLKFKVIARKGEGEVKAPMDKTVALASRPSAQALKALATPEADTSLEQAFTNPEAFNPALINEVTGENTSPGEAPGRRAGGAIQGTQPSARWTQAAPDLRAEPQPAPPPPAPPKPVIGLVPSPQKAVVEARESATVAERKLPPPAEKPSPKAAAKVAKALERTPPPPPPAALIAPPAQLVPNGAKAQAQQVALQAKAAAGKAAAPVERTVPKALVPVSGGSVGDGVPTDKPSVRVRVCWGDQMVACHTFAWGETVVGHDREAALLPLYNFGPAVGRPLAKVHSGGWALHVPGGVRVQILAARGWEDTQASLNPQGEGLVPITPGTQVRLVHAKMSVEMATLGPTPPLPVAKPKIELSIITPLVLCVAAMVTLVVLTPKNMDSPDFVPRQLPQLRAVLKPPDPKKEKPKVKEKLAEKKSDDTAKKDTPAKVTKAPPHPVKTVAAAAAPPPALAALSRLTSAPGMSALLNATSKIPSGGGKGKPSDYKPAGLKGIGPVAIAGFGPGIGGGFGGGPVTGGRSLLGGVGIGGLGTAVSGATRGSPGGIVASAPSRGAQIHGSMTREEVAKVVNAHLQEVRGCYERALLHEPGLAGKLVIEWTIDVSGGVSQFKTKSSSLKSPDVAECILDNMKGWRFPKPNGGPVVVSYPFIFNSVGF